MEERRMGVGAGVGSELIVGVLSSALASGDRYQPAAESKEPLRPADGERGHH
jgi:hypothetical protein